MKFVTLSLAATAGVANAGLALFPVHAMADSVCARNPYKDFTAISALPAAQSFCTKEFSVKPPTCYNTIYKTVKTVTDRPMTKFSTVIDGSITTITTGPGFSTTTQSTLSPSDVVATIYVTAPLTTTVCPTSARTTVSTGKVSPTPAKSSSGSAKKRSPEETPLDKRANAKASSKTSTLDAKATSSLKAKLRSVEAMDKKEAKTICQCIMSNPHCTTKDTTVPTTHHKTSYITKTKIVHPIATVRVPNKHTYTQTNTVIGNRKTVTTISTIIPSGQVTVSQCSYRNNTMTATKSSN